MCVCCVLLGEECALVRKEWCGQEALAAGGRATGRRGNWAEGAGGSRASFLYVAVPSGRSRGYVRDRIHLEEETLIK